MLHAENVLARRVLRAGLPPDAARASRNPVRLPATEALSYRVLVLPTDGDQLRGHRDDLRDDPSRRRTCAAAERATGGKLGPVTDSRIAAAAR